MGTTIDQQIMAASRAGLQSLLELVRELERGPSPLPDRVADSIAEQLIGMARPNIALRVLQGAGDGFRTRQLRAFALAKSGDVEAAIAALEQINDEKLDPETRGLLAGRYKERGLLSSDRSSMLTALEIYSETYHSAPVGERDYYNGINAASLELLVGDRDTSVEIATAVLESVTLPPEKMGLWQFATRGEAHLLLRDLSNARLWYRRAIRTSPNAVQHIATMRCQARANLTKLGFDTNALDDTLIVRSVVVFTGHMIDAPTRSTPRFPASAIGSVRVAIRDRLRKLDAGFGFSSIAGGADVLFLEELLERGGSAHVHLPFPLEDFARSSIGSEWRTRVDRILSDPRVTVTVLADAPPSAELSAAFSACNDTISANAIAFSKRLCEEPRLLAVWDGKPGDGAGGTADTVQAWQGSGYLVEVIEPRAAAPDAVRPTEPAPASAPQPSPPDVIRVPVRPLRVVQMRDISDESEELVTAGAARTDYANRHCLCIGINDYPGGLWRPLANAVHDAEQVGRTLAALHGFSTPRFLLDTAATTASIASAIADDLSSAVGANDLVVVFFAGHGHTQMKGGRQHGFVVPAGVSTQRSSELISMNQLAEWTSYLECRHLLYVFDSCFSGMLQSMSGGTRARDFDPARAHLAITSGRADQPVLDGGGTGGNSVFTSALLNGLRSGVHNDESDPRYTVHELFSFIKRRVERRFPQQTPTLANLPSHDGGDIVFSRPSLMSVRAG